MATDLTLTPVDWSLSERIARLAAAVADAPSLARELAGLEYHASKGDMRLHRAAARNLNLPASVDSIMRALRVAPSESALRAAEAIMASPNAESREIPLAAKAGAEFRFVFLRYILLAYFSDPYADVVVGRAAPEGGSIPYDGPEALAEALGDPIGPGIAVQALIAPQRVAELSGLLDALAIEPRDSESRKALAVFCREEIRLERDLAAEVTEALDELRYIYRSASRSGDGLLVREGG